MKTIKLKTGVVITQNDKGEMISVSSPYWSDDKKISILQRIKNILRLWK